MHLCFHSAERLTGVTVKVSDRTPPVKNPKDLDGSGYSLCAKYSAKPKAGQIINMKCRANAAGRYVYVYIPTTNYLTICEVEVYGDRKYIVGRSKMEHRGKMEHWVFWKIHARRGSIFKSTWFLSMASLASCMEIKLAIDHVFSISQKQNFTLFDKSIYSRFDIKCFDKLSSRTAACGWI